MKQLKFIYLTILLLGISMQGCSQNGPIKEDYVSRENAENIISEKFKEKIKEKNFVVFSIAEKDYLVVIENEDEYTEYYTQYQDGKITSSITFSVGKEDRLYKKMFDKSGYRTDFVTFNTAFFKPSYEKASGNITYFVLKDKKGKSYGESRLSVFVKPNPIDAEVYLNLVNRVLHYINLN